MQNRRTRYFVSPHFPFPIEHKAQVLNSLFSMLNAQARHSWVNHELRPPILSNRVIKAPEVLETGKTAYI